MHSVQQPQPDCIMQPSQPQQFCSNGAAFKADKAPEIQSTVVSQSFNKMRQAAYQRTLEYVEQCQSWAVSSSTHPAATPAPPPPTTTDNMVINDMNSSLNSLVDENKYFQMYQ